MNMKNLTFVKLFALLIFLAGCGSDDNNQAAAQSSGETEALITMVEYSDYQCPACAYFHPIVEQLKETYGDTLEVEYRYFPLNNHQYAALATRAAKATKNQGEFMAMHNMLFKNQESWSAGDAQNKIIGYARKIGLDMDQFREDLNSSETQRTVMMEKQEGQNRGVNSTPSFFVNGRKMDQVAGTYGPFKELVDHYVDDA
jgi:protein-disulfide isomerase